MKKISTLLILSIILCCLQSANAQCVQCDENSNPSGNYASTIGMSDTASGYCSFSGGYNSNSEGQYSFSFGNDAQALGNYSLAIGGESRALHTGSVTIGNSITSNAYMAMVFGHGQYTHPLVNNIDQSIMFGINSDLPTLFIQKAMGIGYTGKIGIGNVTAPQAKLHIRADEYYDTASVYIQTFDDTKDAYLWMGNKNFGLKKHNTSLEFLTTENFVFNNGKVGIGINAPEAKLDVDGTLKSTGFKLVNGTEAYGRMLQSDDQGNATWVDAPGGGCVQCNNTTNTGEFSSAIGQNTTSSEFVSFASGYEVMASGSFSFAHGKFLLAAGTNSVVFGKYANAVASHSMVLGYGSGNLQRLNNNVSNSLMVGFNSSVPTLFIGPSMANGYTGKIGIGNVTDPQAKLHIRADENYDTASVFIQAFNDNKPAYLWMGNKNFGLRKNSTSLEFLTDGDYVFNQGNAGFGTDQPAAKIQVKDGDIFIEDINRGIIMKSPDSNCWRGTVNNQGMLEFVQVDCQTLETGINTPEPSNDARVKIYPNPAGNQVFITCEESLAGLQLEISDISGRPILSRKLRNRESSIDLSAYQPGTYIFRLTNKNGKQVAVQKVIKE